MSELFDRKKEITAQEAALSFVTNRVEACEAEEEKWCNTFVRMLRKDVVPYIPFNTVVRELRGMPRH